MQEFIAALHSDTLRDSQRTSPSCFTRNRKLSFVSVVAYFLSGVRAAVQTELDFFFAVLRDRAALLQEVSAQALFKARKGLRGEVFEALNATLMASVQTHFAPPLWHGLRVVAVDASDVRLITRCAAKRTIVMTKVLGMYLPGLEMMLHAHLYSRDVGERQMLFEQMHRLQPGDLTVLDRGYPAAWLAAVFNRMGYFFCMRVDSVCGKVVRDFRRSGLSQAVVDLPAPDADDARDYEVPCAPVRVRLIRVVTPEGLIRVLMTNLLDESRFPPQAFGGLYHQRWRIEEAFKRLKHRLNLESVSGLSWDTHVQDLGAKLLCDNLNSLLCLEALAQCEGQVQVDSPTMMQADQGKLYKINRTRAFTAVKRCLPRWLQSGVMPPVHEVLALLQQLAKSWVEFVPDRMRPRDMSKAKPHKAFAYKCGA